MTNDPIVITGLGLVTPLGSVVDDVWSRLCAGCSGIRALDELMPVNVAGTIMAAEDDDDVGFDPEALITRKDARKMDRFIAFAIAASDQAIAQAGWRPSTDTERERTATIIATGIGGFHAIEKSVRSLDARGARSLSPFTIPSFLANLAAGWVSMRFGFRGPLGTPVTACAAANQAIGDAARLIATSEADIAICGGAEACITEVSLGGFAAARALAAGDRENPSAASRPFDRSRNGFVMGEGAGILVIERQSHARARGAEPLAQLCGYGTSADAYHLTAPPEDGKGAQRAMQLALDDARLASGDINHINAHATGTQGGDRAELAAIRAVFGENGSPAISATKSAIGHLLGAAGGVEAIFSILALQTRTLPPTLNLTEPDRAAAGLDLVGPQSRQQPIDYVLSNGFGFGGVNASVVFGRM